MKRYLLYTFILTLLALPKQAFAQCDLPSDAVVNTGSNMTVFFTEPFVSSLNTTDRDAYIVALTEAGLIVGSKPVGGVAQAQMAVMADDNTSPEIDGATAGESLSFQLVDGEFLYDIEAPTPVTFTANGISFQTEAASVTLNCQPPVLGCTDENADNYSAEATLDDGSCSVPGCTDETAVNFNSDANQDDNSCIDPTPGCTDALACNFDSLANQDDGSCFSAEANKDCSGDCINDADNNGTCDEDEVGVCTDNIACNYTNTPNATSDNSLCDYPDTDLCEECVDGFSVVSLDSDGDGICNELEVEGCQDEAYFNFDASATDAGICTGLLGCTDVDACNYNEDAEYDSGFCIVAGDCQSCSGETDGTGTVVESIPDNQASTSCDEVYIDASQGSFSDGYKVNFVTTQDGYVDISIEVLGSQEMTLAYLYETNNLMDSDGNNKFSIRLNEQNGTELSTSFKFAFAGGMAVTKKFDYTVGDVFCVSGPVCENQTVPGCTDDNACNYDTTSNANDGSCTYEGPVLDCSGICLNDADGDAVCDENEILGCDIPEAENYDPQATENDDSCIVKACADASACNYNVNATEDDGSCSYPDAGYDCNGDCINDADEDGICDEDEILGCMDNTRCNYDASATDDEGCLPALDGVCETCSLDEDEKPFTDGTGLIVDNDINDNGVCDENEEGCTRPNADNYNPEAITNDGSCLYNGNDACSIPPKYTGNTGANLTVVLTSPLIESLNIDSRNAYLVAKTSEGLIIGSRPVGAVNLTSIAVWGDDSSTDEVDGAEVNEAISFQLLDGENLYDVEMPTAVTFTVNAVIYQTEAATVTLNCTGVEGCNDPLADNFDTSATIDDGTCKYSPCAALVASNFAIEYNAVIAKPVLTYLIKNTQPDQDFLTPDFELFLYSNTFEFLDTTYYSGATITRNGSQTISIPLYNDFTEYLIPDSISGIVRVTGSGSIDNVFDTCEVSFHKLLLDTKQVGCKDNGSYNYSELVTIDNGMCVEALRVNIDKQDPICSYDYGSAIIHVTGDSRSIRSDFSTDTLYDWRDLSGAMHMQDTIKFEDGYVSLKGLDAGEYIIGIKDSVFVKGDTVEVLSLDTFTITSPDSLIVSLQKNEQGYLEGIVERGVVSDDNWTWLYKGVPIESYPEKHDIHYPREAGDYYVYVEDEKGCFSYSDSVNISTPFNGDLSLSDMGDDLFRLYPNPTELELNVDLANLRDDATVVLTDVLGQHLQHLLVNAGASESTYTFDVSEYPSGLYFLRVNQGRSQLVKRFVKK